MKKRKNCQSTTSEMGKMKKQLISFGFLLGMACCIPVFTIAQDKENLDTISIQIVKEYAPTI